MEQEVGITPPPRRVFSRGFSSIEKRKSIREMVRDFQSPKPPRSPATSLPTPSAPAELLHTKSINLRIQEFKTAAKPSSASPKNIARVRSYEQLVTKEAGDDPDGNNSKVDNATPSVLSVNERKKTLLSSSENSAKKRALVRQASAADVQREIISARTLSSDSRSDKDTSNGYGDPGGTNSHDQYIYPDDILQDSSKYKACMEGKVSSQKQKQQQQEGGGGGGGEGTGNNCIDGSNQRQESSSSSGDLFDPEYAWSHDGSERVSPEVYTHNDVLAALAFSESLDPNSPSATIANASSASASGAATQPGGVAVEAKIGTPTATKKSQVTPADPASVEATSVEYFRSVNGTDTSKIKKEDGSDNYAVDKIMQSPKQLQDAMTAFFKSQEDSSDDEAYHGEVRAWKPVVDNAAAAATATTPDAAADGTNVDDTTMHSDDNYVHDDNNNHNNNNNNNNNNNTVDNPFKELENYVYVNGHWFVSYSYAKQQQEAVLPSIDLSSLDLSCVRSDSSDSGGSCSSNENEDEDQDEEDDDDDEAEGNSSGGDEIMSEGHRNTLPCSRRRQKGCAKKSNANRMEKKNRDGKVTIKTGTDTSSLSPFTTSSPFSATCGTEESESSRKRVTFAAIEGLNSEEDDNDKDNDDNENYDHHKRDEADDVEEDGNGNSFTFSTFIANITDKLSGQENEQEEEKRVASSSRKKGTTTNGLNDSFNVDMKNIIYKDGQLYIEQSYHKALVEKNTPQKRSNSFRVNRSNATNSSSSTGRGTFERKVSENHGNTDGVPQCICF